MQNAKQCKYLFIHETAEREREHENIFNAFLNINLEIRVRMLLSLQVYYS